MNLIPKHSLATFDSKWKAYPKVLYVEKLQVLKIKSLSK